MAWKALADERARATMTAFMVILLPVRKRELSWRPARDASVSSELPRSDAVGRRLARRVVDAWEQLRSVALRIARSARVVARALPKGLQLANAAVFAPVFLLRRRRLDRGGPRQRPQFVLNSGGYNWLQ